MGIEVEDKAQVLLEMRADVILITFCELRGLAEVDVECKYSSDLRATDVSSNHPKCSISMWDSTTPCLPL